MLCCGPCALERRYGKDENCGCKLTPWSIFHVLCTDASQLLSYGYWISKQNKNKTAIDENGNTIIVGQGPQEPSQVTCCDLCCVPCLYASERQKHLESMKNEERKPEFEMTIMNKADAGPRGGSLIADQPQTALLLKL